MAEEQVNIRIQLDQQSLQSFAAFEQLLEQAEKNAVELRNATRALNKERAKGGAGTVAQQERVIRAQTKQVELTQKLALAEKERESLAAKSKVAEKMEREANAVTKAQGAYAKLNAELNKLSAEYQEILAKREQGIELTTRETARLGTLEKRLTTLGGAYQRVNRNLANTVGSRRARESFDALGFSVAQMTREAPAFLISMQTGFMALTNNIPIFVDEVRRATMANQALAAQGKATTSVLKQLRLAFFSLHSVVSLFVVLLTVFGPKIIEWARDMDGAKAAAEALTKALEDQKQALEDLWEERDKEMKQLEEYIRIKGLEKDAVATTEQEKTEIVQEGIKGRIALYEAEAEALRLEVIARSEQMAQYDPESPMFKRQMQGITLTAARYDEMILKIRELRAELTKSEGDEERPEATSLIGVEVVRAKGLIEQIDILIGRYQALQKISTDVGMSQAAGEDVDILKGFRDVLTGDFDMKEALGIDDSEIAARVDAAMEALQKKWGELEKLYDDAQKGAIAAEIAHAKFVDTVLQLSAQLTNELFNIGLAVLDSRLEAIQAEIHAEEEKYDRLYDLAEGDREKQREIDQERKLRIKELEKEELEARQRLAKVEKAQAIANAAMNTAVSITRVSWNPVLTALVTAIGAAQIATILATPLPQYRTGRKDGPEELAIVGDGGVPEVIRTKDGRTLLTPNRPTLAYLEKGAEVFRNTNAYRRTVLNEIHAQASESNSKAVEDAIERGFKKAQVNNYLKMPKIEVKLDHQLWAAKQTQF